VITAYAVTAHPGPPLPGDPDLRLVPCDGLAAVCGSAEEEKPSADTLWRHEAVVEALMAERDVVPLRYGTLFDDEAAAAAAIAEHRGELREALARVRGAVEISVRIAARSPLPQPPLASSGRDFLRAKTRIAEVREEARRSMHEPLAARARMSADRASSELPELLRCAFLVDRGAVEEFTAAAAELDRASAEYSLLCTGPWPPYSFVGR
jgi:Gas vesicle synthesis protein GvpL/GvpF